MSSKENALQNPWLWVGAGVVALLFAAVATPNLLRSRIASDEASGVARNKARLGVLKPAALQLASASADRSTLAAEGPRLVRISALELIVRAPDNTASQIIHLTENAGGYLVNSQIHTGGNAATASLTIRVPVAKFDDALTQIRRLGLRVENESIEAQDLTKQFVDQEARLHNLRAEEQQYLGILRKAATVKDTLEVSDKLNEVRGSIEEKQAEFEALSKQVETAAINITLRAEADAQVFGLNWRPLYQLKISAREGLGGLEDYATSMAAFAFYLPTILLWVFTVLVGAAVVWRILRWAGRAFFGFDPKVAPGQ